MADPEKTAPFDAYPPPQNPGYPQIPAETQPPAYPQTEQYPVQQPPVADYPPPQAGYPPQQPDYPPQQPGYPPPQAGYPPQQPGYPQPQQGYQPGYPPPTQQQQSNTTVVVTQQPAAALPTPVFKDHPVVVVDSNGQQVQTILQYRVGSLTWLLCCLICLITGGCWIFALIPCCIDGTKDVVHITPTDGKVVGVYRRL